MSTYETDPTWLAARAEAERDRSEDETPAAAYARRCRAYFRMFDIETAAEPKR